MAGRLSDFGPALSAIQLAALRRGVQALAMAKQSEMVALQAAVRQAQELRPIHLQAVRDLANAAPMIEEMGKRMRAIAPELATVSKQLAAARVAATQPPGMVVAPRPHRAPANDVRHLERRVATLESQVGTLGRQQGVIYGEVTLVREWVLGDGPEDEDPHEDDAEAPRDQESD